MGSSAARESGKNKMNVGSNYTYLKDYNYINLKFYQKTLKSCSLCKCSAIATELLYKQRFPPLCIQTHTAPGSFIFFLSTLLQSCLGLSRKQLPQWFRDNKAFQGPGDRKNALSAWRWVRLCRIMTISYSVVLEIMHMLSSANEQVGVSLLGWAIY